MKNNEHGFSRRIWLKAMASLSTTPVVSACGSSSNSGILPSPIRSVFASASNTQGDFQTQVVLIGAGLAGLTAARRLVAQGIDVIVVEARDRVGGRTLSQTITTTQATSGSILDVGGQWVGPGQDRILTLINELGLKTFKTYETGNYVDFRNGVRSTYGNIFPIDPLNLDINRLPLTDPIASAEAVAAIEQLDSMAKKVPLDKPWTAPNAIKWDSQTAQSWIDANMATNDGKALLSLIIETLACAEPRDLSLLHLLFSINSGGGVYHMIDTTGGAQESRIEGGAQLISVLMAQQLGSRVLLNAPVTRITHSAESVKVTGDNFSVSAKKVIVTLPPVLAGRIIYSPALNGLRDQLTQRVPMGSVIKVHCVYSTPFWREAGLNGQATSDQGPVKSTYDNSPQDASVGVLVGFISGADARAAIKQTVDERRSGVIDSFARYFGDGARTPLEYSEKDWSSEVYSGGAYGGYFPPGVWLDYGSVLREPIGPIHWAGSDIADVNNGYFDGAVRSGEQVAQEVLAALS